MQKKLFHSLPPFLQKYTEAAKLMDETTIRRRLAYDPATSRAEIKA